jgi:cystathionine beta-lyase/cystathionine gamma-synthase
MADGGHIEAQFETLCAESDVDPLSAARPLAPPIVPSAVFAFDSLELLDDVTEGREPGYIYSRDGNPTQAALERQIAKLEGGDVGLACASGMGAIAASLLPGLKAGSRIVAAAALYGRTAALLKGPLAGLGVVSEFVELEDQQGWKRALGQPAAAVIVETISNPLLRLADLDRLAPQAREAGARLIVDNTFATPYHCRPLEHGADVVVHSATKFLGGHSDVTNGVVVGSEQFIRDARYAMSTFGAPASPFDCWLVLRGIRTLALRMERASHNALEIARFLEAQPGVVAVHYPALESHPDYPVARELLRRGCGAMVSFDLEGGEAAASSFIRGLARIQLAPSLGDVSTTVSHPAKTSHRSLSEQERRDAGIGGGLIRLSAGIEDLQDLLVDLESGLVAARSKL